MAELPSPACLDETQLLDLADGVAPAALRASAEAHLDGCPACRELLAGFLQARAPSSSGVGEATVPVTTVVEDTVATAGPRLHAMARGTLLGRYVVLERLGAGGMGVVYAAYDPSIDRRIGLKLVRALPGVENGTERLLSEARAAARTQHPNVVAVHDVGVLGDLVFIAMELVDGGTLRRHLAATRPGWREVVRLYLEAGRGLAAAHAAGVIHRDFKPDNVLVDRTGRVRVMDFGLARVDTSLEAPALPSPGPSGAHGTGRGSGTPRAVTSAAGTPGYIPPEVLSGGAVDARSDQYSFCVSLYEGLHGTRPGTAEPRGGVPRAVQAVVERGLAPDPEARFPTLDALLAALERAAFPRTSRWAAGLGAGVGVAAAIAAIVVAQGPQPCTDNLQRLAGAWDAARATALQQAFLASKAPAAASIHTAVHQTLESYAAAWAEARRDACEATQVRREQSEAAMELRMRCLERRKRELRATVDVLLTASASEVVRSPQTAQGLEPVSTCADVEALSRPVPPPARGEPARRVQAAYERMAEAMALDKAGRWKEAGALASAVTSEAEAVGYKPLLGEALLTMGRSRLHLREEKEAAQLLRRAALAAQAGRDDSNAIEALNDLVFVEGELAERPEQAELWRELAQSLLERMGGDDKLEADMAFHRGMVLVRQGRHADAIPFLQKCLAMRERVFGKDSAFLVDALNTLGTAQRGVGRVEEAVATQRRTLVLLERSFGPDHPFVAMTLNNLAGSLVKLRRYGEARAAYADSIACFERAYSPGQPPVNYLATLYGNMGAASYARGDFEEARKSFERGWSLAREHQPPGHPDRASLVGQLALALANLGRPGEALALVESMLTELETAAADGRRSVRLAEFQVQHAEVLLRVGRFEPSAAAARKAVALLRELGAKDELAGALAMLGMALLHGGHLPEAERAAREALELRQKMEQPQDEGLAEARGALGQVLLARGDAAGARTLLEASLEGWEKDGASALDLAPVRFALARALRQEGGDGVRARALATAAREALAPTAEPRRVRLEEVDAFLGTARVDSGPR